MGEPGRDLHPPAYDSNRKLRMVRGIFDPRANKERTRDKGREEERFRPDQTRPETRDQRPDLT